MTTALSLTTKRTQSTGVEIDDVWYPFASFVTLPDADLATIYGLSARLTALNEQLQAAAISDPSGAVASFQGIRATLADGCKIALPTAPDAAITGIGPEGAAKVLQAFLANATQDSARSPTPGPTRTTRNKQKR